VRRAPQKNAELISYSGQVNGKYQSTEQRRTQKGKAHITEEAGAEEAERLSTGQQEAKSEEVGERTGEAVICEPGKDGKSWRPAGHDRYVV